MRDVPVQVMRVPIAGPRGEIEVRFVRSPRPARWRRRIAAWLIRIAGRIAELRMRILADDESDAER